MFIFVGCTVTPEYEDKTEPVQKVESLATPANIKITNNHANQSITLSWDAVPNATYYVVGYQKATDYASGKDMYQVVVNSTTYTFPDKTTSIDKRYIFKVKAGMRNDATRTFAESSFSGEVEGAIVDTFSVSPIIQNRTLKLYSNYSKTNSILSGDEENFIVSPIVRYFNTDGTELVGNTVENLGSNETYTFTGKLYIDDIEVKTTEVTFQTDVNYVPQPLTSLTAESNQLRSITLNWDGPGINSGIESGCELKYNIQRKKMVVLG